MSYSSIILGFLLYLTSGLIWKGLESKFGFIPACSVISFIFITSYGVYVYIVKAPSSLLLTIPKLDNKGTDRSRRRLSLVDNFELQKAKVFGTPRHTTNNLDTQSLGESSNLLNLSKSGQYGNSNISHTNERIPSQTQLSFFGLNLTTPIRTPNAASDSRQLLFTNSNSTNSSLSSVRQFDITSSSNLAETFIKAASAARTAQGDEGILSPFGFGWANSLSNVTNATPYRLGLTPEKSTPVNNTSKLSSVSSSMTSLVRSSFSSLNAASSNLISGRKSLSNEHSHFTNNSRQGNISSKQHPTSFLFLRDDPVQNKVKNDSTTPIKKVHPGFASPLPSGRSPILLQATENRDSTLSSDKVS
ncbi:uncharacterized protein CMU_037150 [Cryptosporidium muris RN66]|uniref:Uncharacterized protein n=1 Tax=Cryptosporidium muris (strain RN66) TaxID=441375 RepID=B6AH50_CRYMR|nr:uncharacterized protein CMU_037150 [Cryptosporidium muris RN66]EEA07541.1 hypothetical protein, conserved [Cryptosporidium muris RN66]|eukprot:XP_002141890.1 hypothetical protein [Cryptosporidium muris RN66]